jgi:hypothetical protein
MFLKDTEIFYCKNFLSDENFAIIKDLFESKHSEFIAKESSENVWKSRNVYCPPPSSLDILHRHAAEIFLKNFNDLDQIELPHMLHRFYPGQTMQVHHDNGGDDSISYGLVYYLNDDYVGGEIFYPELNLEIKPEANSLVIHPATLEYRHGVRDVVSGDRYTTTMFAYAKLPIV